METTGTPCYNTVAVNQHHARQDQQDAAFDALRDELENDMTRALAGLQTHVPGYSYRGGTAGEVAREVVKSPASEVRECFDFDEVGEALMLALKDSTCPLVAALRKAIIARYVNETADTLADVRGLA